MKKLRDDIWVQLGAALLLAAFLLGTALSGLGVICLAAEDAYYDGGAKLLREHSFGARTFSEPMMMAERYYQDTRAHNANPDDYDPQWEEDYLEYFAPENTNFYFGVYDAAGKLVFSGGKGTQLDKYGNTDFANSRYLEQDTSLIVVRVNETPVNGVEVFQSEEAFWKYADEQYARSDTYGFDYELHVAESANGDVDVTADVHYTEFEEETYTLVGYLREDLTARDSFHRDWVFINGLIVNRDLLIVVLCVSALLSLALFVFLLCAAGHRRGVDGIHLCWFDRLPLDLLTVADLLLIGALIGSVSSIYDWFGEIFNGSWLCIAIPTALYVLLGTALLLPLCMSFAARCKAGGWYKRTLICWALGLCVRFCRMLWRGVCYLCGNLPLYWKAGLLWFGLCLVEFICLIGFSSESAILLWFFTRLALTALIGFVLIGAKKLLAGGQRLAAGELQSKIDTKKLFWDFKRHAEDLNAIGDGMQKAVEQQMRSERLKTELITNVSHDIKTPLTSIVNYVDLLKKEPLEPPKAREYLEVLDRQSARLKKLTEDLVEASKASTGNLSCKLEPTDVNVLLGQVLGEYANRLQTAGLEPVMQLDASSPQISADGRLLWRVFDNLLSNICKYAMSGTRVYLSSVQQNGRVCVTFKNISRVALNISPDELMERFVRGDSSRSTEGSGLGLSIANSLTTIQGGAFDLVVDGDLFKASVTFTALGQ